MHRFRCLCESNQLRQNKGTACDAPHALSDCSSWSANDLAIPPSDPHFLIFHVDLDEEQDSVPPSDGLDLHAGRMATAMMAKHFPDRVNTAMAARLPSTKLTREHMNIWRSGGEAVRELVPLGYAGTPAEFERLAAGPDFIDSFAEFATRDIYAYLHGGGLAPAQDSE